MKILVISPTYNEKSNINDLIDKIFSKYKSVDLFKYKSKGYYIYSNEKIL